MTFGLFANLLVLLLVVVQFDYVAGSSNYVPEKYIALNGIDSYIHIPDIVFPNGPKTVEAWVNLAVCCDVQFGGGRLNVHDEQKGSRITW